MLHSRGTLLHRQKRPANRIERRQRRLRKKVSLVRAGVFIRSRNAAGVICTTIGVVADLWTYPIKALGPVALERVTVEAEGFAGDRERALFVETPTHARFGKTFRGKENALMHTAPDLIAGIAIAERGGTAVRLSEPARYFDAAPVSIIIDTWLRDCERLAGVPVEAQRFRPNIVARSAPGFAFVEADLIGSTIHIGRVVLRVVDAIDRCVAISYDPVTGERDAGILRAVANDRKNIMGVYAEVVQTGTIACGDALTLAQ